MISLILRVLAFVLFLMAAKYDPPQVRLGWLGLACFTLAEILGGYKI